MVPIDFMKQETTAEIDAVKQKMLIETFVSLIKNRVIFECQDIIEQINMAETTEELKPFPNRLRILHDITSMCNKPDIDAVFFLKIVNKCGEYAEKYS